MTDIDTDELAHLWCPDCERSLCGLRGDWAPSDFDVDADQLDCIVCADLYRPNRKYQCCKQLIE